MKDSSQCAVNSAQSNMVITGLKRVAYCVLLTAYCALTSCGDKPTEVVKNDSTKENPLMKNLSDKERDELRKIIASVPIPFTILNRVSDSELPYKKEMLNPDTKVSSYNTAEGQALNIGVYGADLAYIIAFERLGESGAYLKSVRTLADAVVIPTVFDDQSMSRYQLNADKQDSMQQMMYASYTRIDSTLQSNERFGLAALVVTGGWVESLYLTTQQLGNQAKTDSNKLLYEMLDEQQKHTDDIVAMLGMFPNDSLFKKLHNDISDFKKMSSPAAEYTPDDLTKVSAQLAAIRAELVGIE